MDFYADPVAVRKATEHLVAQGDTVFHTHRLGWTEAGHVRRLLEFFDPPRGKTVLDLGCGVGSVADMMEKIRPDLIFLLLNKSKAQLDLAPERFVKICCDFHELPNLHVSSAMMLFALGHVRELGEFFGQVAGVLPRGGVFFIYDLTAAEGGELEETLDYLARPPMQILSAAHSAGFLSDRVSFPQNTFVEHFYNKMPKGQFDRVFAGVSPMLLRLVKQ